ncbi:MAG TPA: efflux RND transporter permease subunit, partial [bacterium]|nr:efflux RND transporter permease subunit [bacterium]
ILKLLKELSKLALIGILLSIGVLYLFIRNVRVSMIICLVIPISIIATFNAMYFTSMSINIISLIGLAVGIGTLIDSAIVVLENVFRHHERGRDPVRSAVVGSHEVGKAIFALTLTNVVVFLPIVFVDGQIRLTFIEGALAIIFPTVISMLVALTLVPMLTAKVLQLLDAKQALLAGAGGHFSGGRWRARWTSAKLQVLGALRKIPHPTMALCRRKYGTLLKSCLRHRVRFLIAVILVVLYTYYYTMSGIQQDVLEAPKDEDSFEVFVYLPNGTKQDYTLQVVNSVEDMILKQVPEIKNLHSWIQDDFASLRVLLVEQENRQRESATIQEELRPFLENFDTAEVTFNRSRTRGENETPPVETGSGGEIEIRGPEYNQINTLAENFAEILMQINGVRDVYN